MQVIARSKKQSKKTHQRSESSGRFTYIDKVNIGRIAYIVPDDFVGNIVEILQGYRFHQITS